MPLPWIVSDIRKYNKETVMDIKEGEENKNIWV